MNSRLACMKDADEFRYKGAEHVESYAWRNRIRQYLSIGPGWRFDKNGEEIALIGYYEVCPGVIQVWMLFNPDAARSIKSLIRVFVELLEAAKQKYHRIQTFIDPMKPQDIAFAEAFGFEFESTMEALGPNGEDVDMYKIILRKPCY